MGSYKNFLLLQESKYGRDKDGEVITYDEYARPSLDVAPANDDDEEPNVELQEKLRHSRGVVLQSPD